jgi:hypothetical protein
MKTIQENIHSNVSEPLPVSVPATSINVDHFMQPETLKSGGIEAEISGWLRLAKLHDESINKKFFCNTNAADAEI